MAASAIRMLHKGQHFSHQDGGSVPLWPLQPGMKFLLYGLGYKKNQLWPDSEGIYSWVFDRGLHMDGRYFSFHWLIYSIVHLENRTNQSMLFNVVQVSSRVFNNWNLFGEQGDSQINFVLREHILSCSFSLLYHLECSCLFTLLLFGYSVIIIESYKSIHLALFWACLINGAEPCLSVWNPVFANCPHWVWEQVIRGNLSPLQIWFEQIPDSLRRLISWSAQTVKYLFLISEAPECILGAIAVSV